MATIHLVDSSPYIFRAFFSVPDKMTGPDGKPVNAVYGFGAFLAKLITEERPSHLALTFDRSLTSSFRNEIYADYKANRDLPPADLEAQLRACEELGEAIGAACFVDERYEADDLIATLRALHPDHAAVVVTNDKDLCQLVDESTTLYDFAKQERYGPAEVKAKFGVRPDQIPDYLGLAGDAVDNIPGVKGIGAKSAAALLAHFGHLELLLERLDEVATLPIRGAKSLARKLEDGRDSALLSKQLAIAARDAPAEASLAELAWKGPERAKVDALFDRLGIGKLRDRILDLRGQPDLDPA